MIELSNLIEVTREYFEHGGVEGFSTFAAEQLERLSPGITAENCVNYFKKQPMVKQTYQSHRFSSLDLTLFSDESFSLDCYVWLKQDTSIHDHHFSGAFKILEGENLQLEYVFEPETDLKSVVNFGNLKLTRQTSQTKGTVEAISLGRQFIHHVTHLTPKVTTLCLRTQKKKNSSLAAYLYSSARLAQPQKTPKEELLLRYLESQIDLIQNGSDWYRRTEDLGIKSDQRLAWLVMYLLQEFGSSLESYPSWCFDVLGENFDFGRLKSAILTHAEYIRRITNFKALRA